MKQLKALLFVLGLTCFSMAVQAADFRLTGLDGKTYQLADFRGKWVVVNFWASWCPPCREEMPELEVFHQEHSAKDAVVIGIDMEDIPRKKLEQFIDEQFVSYPILIKKPGDVLSFGRISALPTTYMVTPEGKVAGRFIGAITMETLEKFIENWKPEK